MNPKSDSPRLPPLSNDDVFSPPSSDSFWDGTVGSGNIFVTERAAQEQKDRLSSSSKPGSVVCLVGSDTSIPTPSKLASPLPLSAAGNIVSSCIRRVLLSTKDFVGLNSKARQRPAEIPLSHALSANLKMWLLNRRKTETTEFKFNVKVTLVR